MKNLFFLISCLCLFSCENELTFDESNFEKNVVVNSIISSDSLLKVNLSYSNFITDTRIRYVADAQVFITNLYTQEEYKLEHDGAGDYISNAVATNSHDYALKVLTLDGAELTSETCIPQDIEVKISIDTIYGNDSYISELEIGLDIVNDPNADNFYTFEVFPYQKRIIQQDSIKDEDNDIIEIFETNSPIIQEDEESSTDSRFKILNLFSDKDLDGEDISTSFSIDSTDISFGDKGTNNNGDTNTQDNSSNSDKYIQTYAIRIMAVSPELFNYMKSYEIANQEGVVNTSGTQPSEFAFNINNGLGVFGGSNIQIIPIN